MIDAEMDGAKYPIESAQFTDWVARIALDWVADRRISVLRHGPTTPIDLLVSIESVLRYERSRGLASYPLGHSGDYLVTSRIGEPSMSGNRTDVAHRGINRVVGVELAGQFDREGSFRFKPRDRVKVVRTSRRIEIHGQGPMILHLYGQFTERYPLSFGWFYARSEDLRLDDPESIETSAIDWPKRFVYCSCGGGMVFAEHQIDGPALKSISDQTAASAGPRFEIFGS